MIAIPFQISPTEYSIFVVLQDENLVRMGAYDPAELSIPKLGLRFTRLLLRDVIIGYATDAEAKQLESLRDIDDVRKALQNLSRGFRFGPDQGDHDGPYQSLRP